MDNLKDRVKNRSKGLRELPERKQKQVREQALKLIRPRYEYMEKTHSDEDMNLHLNAILDLSAFVIPTTILLRLTAEQTALLIDAIADATQCATNSGFRIADRVNREAEKKEADTKQEAATEPAS